MDAIPYLALSREAAEPLTEQLAFQLRDRILSGELLPGDRLPATRQLADSLGVSRTVVVGAYEQLLGEAFLDTTPGSGTLVSSNLPSWSTGQETHERAPSHPAHVTTPATDEPINLCTGRPHVAAEPPREWVRALSRAARSPWFSETVVPQGNEALRRELANHVRLFRGIRCAAEDVIVTSGTSEALLLIGLALRSLKGSSPRIAVEDPGYAEGRAAFEQIGAECCSIEVNTNGIDLRALIRRAEKMRFDAVMVTPSHQFPLGGRLPADERLALLQWAHQKGTFIIEDDYDSEFRHTGALLPSVASLDPHGTTVYVASLNKILSPSLRCGMIVLPSEHPEMRAAILHAREVAGSSVSAHTQQALTQFVRDGGLKRTVARNKREYRHRRALLLDFFEKKGIEVSAADGGLHVVLSLPSSTDADEVAATLHRQGVLVEPLSEFATETQAPNGVALGYGAESIPRLVRGIALVADAVLT